MIAAVLIGETFMRTLITLFSIILSFGTAFSADAARAKKVKANGESGDAVPGMLEYNTPEVTAYNRGVDVLEKKDYATARKYFESALSLNEKFPEAHNNLAYTLRMQSLENADASLAHYNRAIELAPKFAQAHYYRGVLFVQLDRMDDAEKTRVALVGLNTDESKDYANELAKVIKAGKAKSKQEALSIYGAIAQ